MSNADVPVRELLKAGLLFAWLVSMSAAHAAYGVKFSVRAASYNIRYKRAERSKGIARRAEQAVQRCTAERRKPFGGNLAEGDPKDAQAGA